MPASTKKQYHSKKKSNYTVKKFTGLVNKPEISKKGISYSVEKAENIDEKTGKKTEGDIFKKYQNGVLKRQVFVSKVREKKIIKKQLVKNMGGNQPKNLGNIHHQQQQPQVVVVQDGTTFGQSFKTNLAGGFGFGIGMSIIDAIMGE